MRKFSELTLIFSNCLYKGSSWATAKDVLLSVIRTSLQNIENLDFRGINCNNVRGDHSSFTIIVIGVFYQYKQDQDRDSMLNLELLTLSILRQIKDLTFAEVRIEHTRHMSEFGRLVHPQLARTY